MKLNIKYILIKLLLLSFLAAPSFGCSTWDKLDRTERGAVIGTGTGAVIGGSTGSPTGAVIGGVAGGLVGGVVGNQTEDDNERSRHDRRKYYGFCLIA